MRAIRIASKSFQNMLRMLLEGGPAGIKILAHTKILQPCRIAAGVFLFGGRLDFRDGLQERPFGETFFRRIILFEEGLLHRFGTALPAAVDLMAQASHKTFRDAPGFQGGAVFGTERGNADFLGFIQFQGLRLVKQRVAWLAFPGDASR